MGLFSLTLSASHEDFYRFFELVTCRSEQNITQEADNQIKTINITEVDTYIHISSDIHLKLDLSNHYANELLLLSGLHLDC